MYRLRSGSTEELGHVLIKVLWKQFVAANRRGHELAHLQWLEVSDSFKLANQLLKLVPTNMYSHAKAVLCAHVNSSAAFEEKKESPDQHRCRFCRDQLMAHFHHVLWACPHFAATRPTWTVSPLEANLGWPEATTPKVHALACLMHMAEVRAAILVWRHGGPQRRVKKGACLRWRPSSCSLSDLSWAFLASTCSQTRKQMLQKYMWRFQNN